LGQHYAKSIDRPVDQTSGLILGNCLCMLCTLVGWPTIDR